jgi:hypothetical protein
VQLLWLHLCEDGLIFQTLFCELSDFNNGTSGGDNTGWNNLDAAIDVIESGSRWDKQKLVVDAAKLPQLC